VVQGFIAAAGSFYGDLDVFLDALLADVFVEAFGADAGFDAKIFVDGGAGDYAAGWRFALASGMQEFYHREHRGRREEKPDGGSGAGTSRAAFGGA